MLNKIYIFAILVLFTPILANAYPSFAMFTDDLEVCSVESIPSGYVKSDSYFQLGRCNGNYLHDLYDKQDLSAPDNIWVLTKYTELETEDELEVCYNSSVPSGWKRVDSYFQVGRCNGNYLFDVAAKRDLDSPDNVYTIRKIQ